MNQFNIMFAFDSAMNRASKGDAVLTPATPTQQMALYAALKAEFTGTELEDGLRRNWFDEFKPSYCTNAFNCGERFYLLQSDGSVYSCVRGQGIEEFHYGNVFTDSIDDILTNGARKIESIHQAHGFDENCQRCGHLSLCHTGCPVVKHQRASGRSYTCELQKQIYADNPRSFPISSPAQQREDARHYQLGMHPTLAFAQPAAAPVASIRLPNDLVEDKNTLQAMIAADSILQELYSDTAFILEVGDELIPLTSQLLKDRATWYTLVPGDRIVLHAQRSIFDANCPEFLRNTLYLQMLRDTPVVYGDELIPLTSQLLKDRATWHTLVPGDRIVLHARRSVFDANCTEFLRNTLYLQMLRDTPVVYGDEQRTKQEHVFTYQLFASCLVESVKLGTDYLTADLSGLIELHRNQYRRGVRNNLFFSTLFLREYHYQKQKNNAFYHIQAINLPFQNFEFNYPVPKDMN